MRDFAHSDLFKIPDHIYSNRRIKSMAQPDIQSNSGNAQQSRGAGPAEGVRRAAGEAAEANRSFAGAATQAAGEAADASEQVFKSTVGATGEAMQSGLRSAESALQAMAESLNRTFGMDGPDATDLSRRSTDNVRAVSGAAGALSRGAQQVSREWLNLSQQSLRAHVEALARLSSCRSATHLLAVQSDVWRETLERTVEGSRAIANASLTAVDEASRALQQQHRT